MNSLALRSRIEAPASAPCPYAQQTTAPTLWKQLAPMTIADFRTIAQATETLVAAPRYSASGLGALTAEQTQDAKNVLAAAGVMLVARGLAGWYVGSKMGRPTGGAILGSIFGPVGLGILSFWKR